MGIKVGDLELSTSGYFSISDWNKWQNEFAGDGIGFVTGSVYLLSPSAFFAFGEAFLSSRRWR